MEGLFFITAMLQSEGWFCSHLLPQHLHGARGKTIGPRDSLALLAQLDGADLAKLCKLLSDGLLRRLKVEPRNVERVARLCRNEYQRGNLLLLSEDILQYQCVLASGVSEDWFHGGATKPRA